MQNPAEPSGFCLAMETTPKSSRKKKRKRDRFRAGQCGKNSLNVTPKRPEKKQRLRSKAAGKSAGQCQYNSPTSSSLSLQSGDQTFNDPRVNLQYSVPETVSVMMFTTLLFCSSVVNAAKTLE